jgi:CheY-like chemotaxis protein
VESLLTFDQFASELRAVLNRVFDLAYLEKHPLCQAFFPGPALDGRSRAERFRRMVLEAIEELAPPDQVAVNTREWRSYHILCGRYIEKVTPSEMMGELSLSQRQFFREQRSAIDGLVALLWEKYLSLQPNRGALGDATDDIREPEMLREEVERLTSLPEKLDARELVEGVLRTLEPLCQEKGVHVSCSAAHDLPLIHISRVVARQVLIQLLSHCMTQTATRRIRVDLSRGQSQVIMRVTGAWDGEPSGKSERSLALDAVRHMLADARGQWLGLDLSGRGFSLKLSLPTGLPRVLLAIEDNPGAVQLLRRYLARSDYQVVEATCGHEMIPLVESVDPGLILLDIMLPGRDGWEILHELQSNSRTKKIPILVCSVLDERELARALGASAYLKKPYSQSQLIETLNQL